MFKKFNNRILFKIFFMLICMLGFADGQAQTRPCIFCRIASGEIQASRVVYRDKYVVAFTDHAPQNPGHILVIPLIHEKEIINVPEKTAGKMMNAAQKIAAAIRKTDIKAEGFRFQLNMGEAAGQEVPHAHMHIIPRFAGDNFLSVKKEIAPSEELDAVAKKIREALVTN